MFSAISDSFKIDQRLFRVEIRASIAHCNGLFRAGILTRQESERLKNALWTILKRADFDVHFLDQSNSPDIFTLIEARLFQLVNDACYKIEIGRTRASRAATALRLFVRDEIEVLAEMLDVLHEDLLQDAHKSNLFAVFLESFHRDHERLREILKRTNQMPIPQLNAEDEATSEIDFAEIAHELEFASVLGNALDGISDRDFCVEFVNAAALLMLHLTSMGNTLIARYPEIPIQNRRIIEVMRGKCSKIFGLNAALLSLLKNLPIEYSANDLEEVCEVVFETVDTLKACLHAESSIVRELA